VPAVGAAGAPGNALITTPDDADDVHPVSLVTVKLYVPGISPVMVVVAPIPVIVPGLTVQLPAGKPFNITLPVATAHVGCVIVPIVGDALIFKVNMAVAAAHGEPSGLSVVTVIITIFPSSPAAGVYVKANGDVPDEAGLTEPAPFSVIITVVAFVKVLPLMVIGAVTQVLPFVAESVSTGVFAHTHVNMKLLPVVVQPAAFLTLIEWLPLAIPVNVTPGWYGPPSILYSRPAPVGLVTVMDAFPDPGEQSVVNSGVAGAPGAVLITTLADAGEAHPEA